MEQQFPGMGQVQSLRKNLGLNIVSVVCRLNKIVVNFQVPYRSLNYIGIKIRNGVFFSQHSQVEVLYCMTLVFFQWSFMKLFNGCLISRTLVFQWIFSSCRVKITLLFFRFGDKSLRWVDTGSLLLYWFATRFQDMHFKYRSNFSRVDITKNQRWGEGKLAAYNTCTSMLFIPHLQLLMDSSAIKVRDSSLCDQDSFFFYQMYTMSMEPSVIHLCSYHSDKDINSQ